MAGESLRVLIVDDQPAVVTALEVLLDINDIPHAAASTPDEAHRIAAGETLGAVIQDMNFARNETSGAAGMDLYRSLHELQPGLPILLMTAWASIETAVEMVRNGAADYVEKPWDDDKLIATLNSLLRMRRLELENARLRRELTLSRDSLAAAHDLGGIVYASEAMHTLISLAVNVAGSNAPVLVTGPNGSGKERLAEIVQRNSRRKDAPFVRVNVGAIPEELMESELFGAEAGAYSGLRNRRIGHFETADSGTMFLDEIDALSLTGQVKMLRVLQSGEFQRLGSSRTHRADIRIISATNADLRAAIEDGRFREDLFFRLNVVELPLPPLAERREDILPLARHFLENFLREDDGAVATLTDTAAAALLRHTWTGNVRELENRIRRATLVAVPGEITAADLDLATADAGDRSSGGSIDLGVDETLERQRLVEALSDADGIVARAADQLGISRQALYRKMSRLGIEVERRAR